MNPSASATARCLSCCASRQAVGDQPHRLYREGGLIERKRRARRRTAGALAPILVEAKPNARRSLDFVHDQILPQHAIGYATRTNSADRMLPRPRLMA